jgi:catechol 2,3-dioxygenase-like lactoylglutathione lyase family enzyme
MAGLVVDHLVLVCADLEQGAAFVRQTLAMRVQTGGRHEFMGTHNKLLRLGSRCYLELIAIDRAAKPPTRPRWFGMDDPALQRRAQRAPFFATWVAATDEIDADARRMPHAGEVISASRGELSWKITVPADGSLAHGGAAPALIQWQSAHPCDQLREASCALHELQLRRPQPEPLRELIGEVERVSVERGAPSIRVTFETPAGLITL